MNHPYLFPDEAPWTEDYHELRAIWRAKHGICDPEREFDDEQEREQEERDD
jgi:hypothetical protein